MAGGRGTRLMPLTKNRPKPMVPVLGRPVIDYVKDAMLAAGREEGWRPLTAMRVGLMELFAHSHGE